MPPCYKAVVVKSGAALYDSTMLINVFSWAFCIRCEFGLIVIVTIVMTVHSLRQLTESRDLRKIMHVGGLFLLQNPPF